MIEWVADLVASGGTLGVFLLMLAENLFPPIPSEVIMPLAGFAAARGQMSLVEVLLAGTAGTVAGNAFWYEGARWIGADRLRPLVARHGRYVRLTEATVRAGEAALQRRGRIVLFTARLMAGLRTFISIPAGLVHIPRPIFYLYTTLGSALWISLLALLGYWLEEQYERAAGWLGPLSLALLVFGVLFVAWRIWLRQRVV